MLTLASLRYRNVLAVHGGPIQRIETGVLSVRGRRAVLANAHLAPGLIRKGPLALYSDADGTGMDRIASVARHKAVSEAMERWAFHSTVRSERAAEFGFDVDSSTTGMSAFPGLLRRQARRSAVLEAVERFSLSAWWEGRIDGELFETDWPGVSALAIDGPFGGMTVIAFAKTEWGGYVYGHAAEESFGAACDRAVAELARHEWILRSSWLAFVAGQKIAPTNIFERRCLFFAGAEGQELFQERLGRKATGTMPRAEIICDRDIPGPWDTYATAGDLRCGHRVMDTCGEGSVISFFDALRVEQLPRAGIQFVFHFVRATGCRRTIQLPRATDARRTARMRKDR